MGESFAVALAGLLAVAAAAKLRRPSELARLLAHAIGGRAARPLALATPLAEVSVAVVLVAAPASGLVAASLLFGVIAAFLTAFGRKLRGRACTCFGGALPSAVGPRLTWRAWVLAGVSAIAAAMPEGRVGVAGVTVSAAILVLIVAVGRDRGDAPDGGAQGQVELPGAPRGRVVIVFLHPACPVCVARAPGIGALAAARHAAEIRVAVITGDDADGARRLASAVGPPARLDHDEVAQALAVRATPHAVVVEDGRVLARLSGPTDEELARLARGGAAQAAPPDEALTRVDLLRRAAGLMVGVLAGHALALAGPALAGSARTRRVRDALAVPAVPPGFEGAKLERFPTGRLKCWDFYRRVRDRGVTVAGRKHRGFAGWTQSAPPRRFTACNETKAERFGASGWQCPCIPEPFPTETRCFTECPKGLRCFATQCQRVARTHCCVTITFDVCGDPSIQVGVLEWQPPEGASKACEQLVSRVNAANLAHEAHHVADDRRILGPGDDARNRSRTACADDCGTAEDKARGLIEELLEHWGDGRVAEGRRAGDEFHRSPEGQYPYYSPNAARMTRAERNENEGREVIDCAICDDS